MVWNVVGKENNVAGVVAKILILALVVILFHVVNQYLVLHLQAHQAEDVVLVLRAEFYVKMVKFLYVVVTVDVLMESLNVAHLMR